MILLGIILLYPLIKIKIHDSYHKGYNEAKNDEIFYYATIKTLKDTFTKIMKLIRKIDIALTLELSTLLIEYNDSLKIFQKKY